MNQQDKHAQNYDPKKNKNCPPFNSDIISTSDKTHHAENGKISRRFIIILLFLAAVSFVPIISIFIVPIVLAITFTGLLFPLYMRLLPICCNNRSLCSLLCCCIFFTCLLIPTIILIHMLINQATFIYTYLEPTINEVLDKGSQSQFIQQLLGLKIFKWLEGYQINWQGILENILKSISTLGTFVLNKTSSGIFGLISNLFITLFTMFYFFIDGEKVIDYLFRLSPFKPEYQSLILSRFLLISRATIFGTLLIGLIQGSLGAITFLICGIKSWVLWGFVMIIFSIVPLVGAWLVMIPAGIIQIILGNIWQGVAIILSCLIVVSNIDNLIRPKIVGHGAKMHDLFVFFSTLGGLSVFGVAGFIIGPIIASFFIAMIDIFEMEFHPFLQKNKDD